MTVTKDIDLSFIDSDVFYYRDNYHNEAEKMKRTKKIAKDKDGNIGSITTYDENGNKIHFKSSNGYEIWSEYDEKGNCIHFKSSDGYEIWSEYDENGNMIHIKDSDGIEQWHKYDDKNREIYFKDSATGGECFYEYEEE